MTHKKKAPLDPPYSKRSYAIDDPALVEALHFARYLNEARRALTAAGGNPDEIGGAGLCWNMAKKMQRNRVKAEASKRGGEKTKGKAAKRHKEIAAALASGQTVKAVQLEREITGKTKALSERTIRRVKRAKGP